MPDAPYRTIPLRARDGSIRAHAIVDVADFDWLNQWRWCLNRAGYVVRNRPKPDQGMIRMNRLILGLAKDDAREGDHENRNRLDNRRTNLRIAERGHADNGQNLGLRSDNSSGYRGVYWHKSRHRWVAQGTTAGKTRHLGLFATAEEADAAAKAFRAEHMPFSEDARHQR